MKIKDFQATEILLKPTEPREFDLVNFVRIIIRTVSFGDIELELRPPFHFNARSGPIFVDYFIPHVGNQDTLGCFATHDAFGHDIGLSFETTNDFLDQMLELSGHSDIKSDIVEAFVSISDNWFGCENEKEIENRKLIKWRWVDKSKYWNSKLKPKKKPTRNVFKRIWRWFKS
jgi:hypothetical protein